MYTKTIKCQQCALASVCLPITLTSADLQRLEDSVTKQQSYARGDYLARTNKTLSHFYALRAGAFKAVKLDEQGNQHLLNFYLPGELMGLDCIADNKFHYDLIALEDSCVCEVSKDELFSLASYSKNLQAHLFSLMSRGMCHQQWFNPNASADEKVANFLSNLYERSEYTSYNKNLCYLPMPREDIGNYLGLATETVIRSLKKFEKANIISIANRTITQLDAVKLREVYNN